MIKNLKNNYKMKELQCLKYENEIYEFKQRIKKLKTDSSSLEQHNSRLQNQIVTKELTHTKTKQKIKKSLLENLLQRMKLERKQTKSEIERKL